MAESHKFTGGRAGLEEAKEVFPDLPWKWNYGGTAYVFDEKKEEYVAVNEGDYIVHIGNRYEVTDKKPRDAKKATASNDEKSDDTKASSKKASDNDVPEAKEVEPQPDPEEGEAEVASTPNGATSFGP